MWTVDFLMFWKEIQGSRQVAGFEASNIVPTVWVGVLHISVYLKILHFSVYFSVCKTKGWIQRMIPCFQLRFAACTCSQTTLKKNVF